ncbi:long-chain-fatty-acid--CoA ligase [Beijerinckia indica]|uniref:Long-chain-fatty-acid--CoA ligase n=1 Tax=Beijerinckia indica subsp. indica (strain ATCC 9039 / DSM 1715 / NCIMB 8712) TaxID=395963 RepID=B2IEQ3_BEII9|nr:long-chain fatty acid--CoA ligase [Beijerinckia indica]ACB96993.1 AMP-dependent synthetase and ligase [Beijerinckia indica subsp. indica ATCC 9039]
MGRLAIQKRDGRKQDDVVKGRADWSRPNKGENPVTTPNITTPYHLLGDMTEDLARRRGDAPAFTTILPNGMSATLSFQEVEDRSNAFAAFLRGELGVQPGERIMVLMPNGLAYPIVAFGTFKAGCILVNVNPLYTAAEISYVVKDAEPSVVVVLDMIADRLEAALQGLPYPTVIIASVAECFSWPRKLLISLVQKHIRSEIPRHSLDSMSFASVLRDGAALITNGAERAAHAATLSPETIACLQYTGGTTGVSKGAMLSHYNLLMNVAQFMSSAAYDVNEEDVMLTVLPLYHIFAFTVNLLGLFSVGGRNILIPNPRPLGNLRSAFKHLPITLMTGVNPLFRGLVNEAWFRDAPPPSLRLSWAGGTALQVDVARDWEDCVGSPVIEGYGLTEASPVVTFNPVPRPKPGSIGVALPDTEVKCVDENDHDVPCGTAGELVLRGPQVMLGYWRQKEETAHALRGGWLHTGDLATMDEEGYFTLIDRLKDMILVSGFNVYPSEIEAVLSRCPGVVECCVVGVPDPIAGEVPKAFVVRSTSLVNEEKIRHWCRRELASYKLPRHVEFRESLPKSMLGKVLRKDLRGSVAAK